MQFETRVASRTLLPGLWQRNKVARTPHSTAASCILHPTFLWLFSGLLDPLLPPRLSLFCPPSTQTNTDGLLSQEDAPPALTLTSWHD